MSCQIWFPKNVPKCKVLLDAVRLNFKDRYSARMFLTTKARFSPKIKQHGFVCSSREKHERTTRMVGSSNYTTSTIYLPYQLESIEQVENYDNLNNCIDSLVTTTNDKIKRVDSTDASPLYNNLIQIKTKYTPLNIHSERQELLQDWNELIAIITDMEIVPEEADQVS